MKNRTLLISVVILIAATAAVAQEHKLVQFQMAILRKGPQWEAMKPEDRNKVFLQHRDSVVALYNSGKMVMAGPFADETNLAGIFVLRATAAEAKTLVAQDPAVKAGLMSEEIHPWYSEDIFRKPATPLKMNSVYFGFLKKGPNRKDGDSDKPEIQELQKAHIANINRLAELKKLVVAGPFGDEGELRGIFVFRVNSLQEAQDLAATDPMIKINRLRIELHPWNVPEGVLP
jgi:uncharacterized protein YciI